MTKQEQILNWLAAGLSQPESKFSELFYFDRKNNQFFSILITDYFLFDDNFDIPHGTSSTYSGEELVILAERMKRIDSEDTSIIAVPRAGQRENSSDGTLTEKARAFLYSNDIDINAATVWEPGDDVTITIKVQN